MNMPPEGIWNACSWSASFSTSACALATPFAARVLVMIVAPEDRIERPVRRHQRAARQRGVLGEDLRGRRAVDYVVGDLRRVEVEARLTG
jgi:hypothetical protein